MQIDTVVYFQITDPKLYTYGIEQPMVAIENLSATTLRNIIGDLELDQCLTSRDIINTKMRAILDEGDRPLGHQGQPRRAQEHSASQGDPERDGEADEGRARTPRGHPACRGREARRNPRSRGRKRNPLFSRADAKKQQQILEAEGEAEAILKVQKATAEGIRLINEAAPSEAVIKIKALEAFSAAANGKATKIIIPSEIQGVAGLASGLVEAVKGDVKSEE